MHLGPQPGGKTVFFGGVDTGSLPHAPVDDPVPTSIQTALSILNGAN